MLRLRYNAATKLPVLSPELQPSFSTTVKNFGDFHLDSPRHLNSLFGNVPSFSTTLTTLGNTAAAPAPKLSSAQSSGTLQQHQHPAAAPCKAPQAHTAAAHSSAVLPAPEPGSQARTAAPRCSGTSIHTPNPPCSGTSTQARKRTHADFLFLEARTPIAHAFWGKQNIPRKAWASRFLAEGDAECQWRSSTNVRGLSRLDKSYRRRLNGPQTSALPIFIRKPCFSIFRTSRCSRLGRACEQVSRWGELARLRPIVRAIEDETKLHECFPKDNRYDEANTYAIS